MDMGAPRSADRRKTNIHGSSAPGDENPWNDATQPGTGPIEVSTHGLAIGGDAVGRDGDGRVVFVAGALAGERVRVRVRSARDRYAHADLVEVIEPSPDRRAPVCPHVAAGCGGCGWAHIDPATQRTAKVDAVAEALTRLGRLDAPVVQLGPQLAGTGFRTTVRAAVADGRAGYRRAASADRLAVDSCRVAHPMVEEMLVSGHFGDADEVVLRVGARTGERLVRVAPTAAGVTLPASPLHPELRENTPREGTFSRSSQDYRDGGEVDGGGDLVVIGADALAAGERAWIHEEVAGVRLRVSADSFFQSRADGADALVAAVAEAVGFAERGSPMADLYCGVGLFAATVGRDRPVVAVERSRSSIADARVNLAGLDAKVIRSGVEKWRPSPARVVVADPPRAGLGRIGVDKVGATGAKVLALVSCDAASLGRDAGLLAKAGWRHHWSRLIDLFPDTPHVEVVTLFTR